MSSGPPRPGSHRRLTRVRASCAVAPHLLFQLNYLKEKCDAGGDAIITQLFYDFDVFVSFHKQCRAKGINVPILPGIMPLNAYGGFKRMTVRCRRHRPCRRHPLPTAPPPPSWLPVCLCVFCHDKTHASHACVVWDAQGFCKTRIPKEMMIELDKLKGDDCKDAFVEFGLKWLTNMCQQIVEAKLCPGLHFYCLNQAERSYQIMERLGYLRPA